MAKKLRHPRQTPLSESGRVVRRAAKFIQEHGWIRGSEGNKTVGFCVRGAITNALPLVNEEQEMLRDRALTHFAAWLRAAAPEGEAPTIPTWNDKHAADEEEVLLYMNKFADEMDPQR